MYCFTAAYDRDGAGSSHSLGDYASPLKVELDDTVPAAPTGISTTAGSSGRVSSISVVVAAAAGSTVQLYSDNSCSVIRGERGVVAAGEDSVTIVAGVGTGLNEIYAGTVDIAGNVSCYSGSVAFNRLRSSGGGGGGRVVSSSFNYRSPTLPVVESDYIRELRERIEYVRGRIQELRALSGRAPTPSGDRTASIRARILEIQRSLERARSSAPTSPIRSIDDQTLDTIWERVDSIQGRVGAVGSAADSSNSDRITALQSRIAEIQRNLERTRGSGTLPPSPDSSRIAALQARIAEIQRNLERTRSSLPVFSPPAAPAYSAGDQALDAIWDRLDLIQGRLAELDASQ